MRSTSSPRGFTLIEILVTLSLSALLLAVAVPSFVPMINRQRLIMATNDLNLAFTLARSEAIRRGVRVAVAPTVAKQWTEGWRVFVDSNNNGVFDEGEQLIQEFAAPDAGISIRPKGSHLDEVVSYNDIGFPRQPGNDGLALGHFIVRYGNTDAQTICFSTARTRVVRAVGC